MITAGIIAEYNPFHTGHLFQLQETEKKADFTVVVMSGNAVQRGGCAFFSKWDRARAAIRCGADLVLELPAVWASAPAERFASAGISLLYGTGCVSFFSCGSEAGNADQLEKAALLLEEAERSPMISQFLKSGMTYAAAREKTFETLAGSKISGLLCDPNNILALEYLKANRRLHTPMNFMTVKRKGAGHDSDNMSEDTASASFLRDLLGKGQWEKAFRFLPAESIPVFQEALTAGRFAPSYKPLDRTILYRLYGMTPEKMRELPDLSEGLENRFLAMAEKASSVEELLTNIKTRRYTLSRLRRILWNMMLENKNTLTASSPPYLRVLDFEGVKGRMLLKEMKRTARLPIYHSMAELERDFPAYAAVEKNATLLFNLCCSPIGQVSEYPKHIPFVRNHS